MASYTVPAIAGHMGSTKYYQAVMRADELAATVHAAMDFEEFDSFMASERMQRKLSEERVERQIVPYLTNSADRFFGSIIVLVYKPERFNFETLSQLGSVSLDPAYREVGSTMGALTIEGGKLFALDGQHRLHALRTVVGEKVTPRLKLPIDGPYRDQVKDDMLSVIFLEFFDTERARRIFNKVNRYAKPTSKSTNILTSEDDGLAIIARSIAGLDDPGKFDSTVTPPIPLAMNNGKPTLAIEGSSLRQTDPNLSNLEFVYKSVKAICDATGQPALDEATTIVRPDDEKLRVAYEVCVTWWKALMNDFDPYRQALKFPDLIVQSRAHAERHSVAFRPVGQEAIIHGLMDAHKRTKLPAEELIRRLNKLPLSLEDDCWIAVLLGGGETRVRILGYTPLAGLLISYMLIGPDAFGAIPARNLLEEYRQAKAIYGIDRRVLPKAVV